MDEGERRTLGVRHPGRRQTYGTFPDRRGEVRRRKTPLLLPVTGIPPGSRPRCLPVFPNLWLSPPVSPCLSVLFLLRPRPSLSRPPLHLSTSLSLVTFSLCPCRPLARSAPRRSSTARPEFRRRFGTWVMPPSRPSWSGSSCRVRRFPAPRTPAGPPGSREGSLWTCT